jgi:hypothetical protein
MQTSEGLRLTDVAMQKSNTLDGLLHWIHVCCDESQRDRRDVMRRRNEDAYTC